MKTDPATISAKTKKNYFYNWGTARKTIAQERKDMQSPFSFAVGTSRKEKVKKE